MKETGMVVKLIAHTQLSDEFREIVEKPYSERARAVSVVAG